jgi:hypothetical protein
MSKKNFLNLPSWLKFNRFYRGALTKDYCEEHTTNGQIAEAKECKRCHPDTPPEEVRAHPYEANLISSEKPNGKHALLLDLDVQHFYTKSTHNGHLYVDVDLDAEALEEIITVLNKHGIIQDGILGGLKRRGYLAHRLPGQKKGSEDDMSFEQLKEHEKREEQKIKQSEDMIYDAWTNNLFVGKAATTLSVPYFMGEPIRKIYWNKSRAEYVVILHNGKVGHVTKEFASTMDCYDDFAALSDSTYKIYDVGYWGGNKVTNIKMDDAFTVYIACDKQVTPVPDEYLTTNNALAWIIDAVKAQNVIDKNVLYNKGGFIPYGYTTEPINYEFTMTTKKMEEQFKNIYKYKGDIT